ncbi:hypothetical protein ACFQ15_02700 [Sphingomonas hankookensis]|uniref:hypothetical protein n=1 Tax=Sphingomonas hankookensis TaxID=563996 RepID=UPI001F5AFC4C|nr:hypothetical protein [Sphingomonas hankookensis]
MSTVLSILRKIVAFLLGKLMILWDGTVRNLLTVEQVRAWDFAVRFPVQPHAGLVLRPVQGWVAP